MKLAKRKLTKKVKIAIIVSILLLLLLIILFANKNKLFKLKALANSEYSVTINTTVIDISKATTNEPNVPVLGAGMIPIKWENDNWVITNKNDKDWYNYSSGITANVMLSDGKYVSELTRDKELAVENTVLREEELGTIFTWIPRLMYKEDRVEYLKDTSMIEYEWTTPSCFTYYQKGIKEYDLAFTGMWVSNKATGYINNAEDNKYGLIRNEIVSGITNEELIVVQKLDKKLGSNSNLTNANSIQTIKILNTNMYSPITTAHKISADSINLQIIYHKNSIEMVLDKDGNNLSISTTGNVKANIDEDGDEYIFYVVDSEGNIRKHSFMYTPIGRPDLTGFNLNTTFYVTYDEAGNEESIIPIGEKKPKTGWYDYENQM